MHKLARRLSQAAPYCRAGTQRLPELPPFASQRHWPLITICYDVASGDASHCHGSEVAR